LGSREPYHEAAHLLQYPGGDLVLAGLVDLERQFCSDEALLVSIAGPRLRGVGIEVPELLGVLLPYEHRLYESIESRMPCGAHAEYNAMIGRIVSFANTYESAKS